MAAFAGLAGDFGRSLLRVNDEVIDQAGLSDTGLANYNRAFIRESVLKVFHTEAGFRAAFHDR